MNINEIKPDPDQPRRTFNEEKMEALRASMRTDGFRKQYPIIINGGNHIIDGERRWRAANAVGIKEVPVEIRHDVTPEERLLYQLNSEGAELVAGEKDDAHLRLYEMGLKRDGKKYTHLYWAIKRGLTEDQFKSSVSTAKAFRRVEEAVGATDIIGQYSVMTEIGREKKPEMIKKLAEKAIKEKWTSDVVRGVKSALKERPMKTDEILSHDYSGPNWEEHLEVAKTGFSSDQIKKLEEVSKGHEAMMDVIQTLSDIVTYGLKMQWAMQKLGDKYKLLTPGKRAEHHAKVKTFLPFAVDYITEIENYMISNGELQRNQKLLK